jgi:hypothetical protein
VSLDITPELLDSFGPVGLREMPRKFFKADDTGFSFGGVGVLVFTGSVYLAFAVVVVLAALLAALKAFFAAAAATASLPGGILTPPSPTPAAEKSR